MSNEQQLFSELLLQLGDVKTAMLLVFLLQREADVKECKTSLGHIAKHRTGEFLTKQQTRLAADKLIKLGLIGKVIHPNTNTYFTVNRAAVLELLAQPLPPGLPGTEDRNFPFLEAWQQARDLSLASQSQALPQSGQSGSAAA